MIIGQPDLNSNSPNGGQTAPTANTLALENDSGVFRAGLALDAQGNLWVSDPGNNRVLRFPASELTPGSPNQPSADLVLGQSDFSSTSLPANMTRSGKNYLSQPSGLAFDLEGRLFIADNANRVVVYAPPFGIGQASARVMGVVTTPNAPLVSESTLGAMSAGRAVPPQAIFFIGDDPYVVDTGNARILSYSPFAQWPAESTRFRRPRRRFLDSRIFKARNPIKGWRNQTLGRSPARNQIRSWQGRWTPSLTASEPSMLPIPEITGCWRFRNNRSGHSPAPRACSVSRLRNTTRSTGLTAAKWASGATRGSCSVNGALQFLLGGSAVIDGGSTPPHLYIADALNNRVLGYKDYRQVHADVTADLVIGQPDLNTALVNYPSNSPTQTNAQGLWSPEGLALDAKGNLYVADTCNARVVRFPAPFEQAAATLPQAVLPQADLVLGQTSLTGQPIKDVSAQTMKSAYGIAFTSAGNLVVSDPAGEPCSLFPEGRER